ncbi:MAG: hypothetical protein K0B01_13050 [Syntrophobacterales bacterium]|nr:hypothetical protein [Syntrophobacterales bacterium]
MAGQYTTRNFLRQMPNELLAHYFNERGLFGDMDFSAMKEGKPDELFTAWLALPDSQRNNDGCGVPTCWLTATYSIC